MFDPESLPVATLLARGIEFHTLGRWAEAEQLYRRMLHVDPSNADALHLLGVIAFQRGDQGSAINQIQRAIAINPQEEAFHSNLGAVYQEASRFDEALACYRALELKPSLAECAQQPGQCVSSFGATR